MTDRPTFDSFEQRIAEELERYVAPVTDPKPAEDIAQVAMRPRGLSVRARNASRRRRFLLLGLAAALLVPATYFGAASLLPPVQDVVQPARTPDPRPTVVPSTSVASSYVSIFVRRDEGPEPGAAIFAVRSDGAEQLLRKVPDSMLSGKGKMSEWGTASESGWLALGVDLYGGPWPMVLVDLRDEQSQPWFVNEANVGAVGPRWGPTGLVAASLGLGGAVITDPETRITADWHYVGAPVESPDRSTLLTWIDIGAKPAAVLVPLNGDAPTFHTGQFAGFVDSGASAVFTSGQSGAPVESIPAVGNPYAVPPLDELIAAELGLNPGRVVLGKASHDAVDGATEVRMVTVRQDRPGAGDAYLDCYGPSSVTVTSGSNALTSPCLSAGSFAFGIDPAAPLVVTASGDTTWRVVIYSP